MTRSTEQACAIAAVTLLRQSGENVLAERVACDLLHTPLFEDEPIVTTLTAMLVGAS